MANGAPEGGGAHSLGYDKAASNCHARRSTTIVFVCPMAAEPTDCCESRGNWLLSGTLPIR